MLHGLHVLHHRKEPSQPVALSQLPHGTSPTLILDTCQRWLCVLQSPEPFEYPSTVDHLSGEDAYHFLLRITTGLESRLQGETNIFGQVKQAWAPHGTAFPWLQRLFEDTKEIRAQHLADVGGPSYGRLVRKLLHPLTSGEKTPTLLLVGAGELARAVAPWLTGFRIQILNRNAARATELAQSLRNHGHTRHPIEIVPSENAPDAWQSADAVVVCIPYDADADAERIRQIRDSRSQTGTPIVIHLGGADEASRAWYTLPNFHALDDIFRLHNEEAGPRMTHLRRAERACLERARLRALGPSLSIPHGWEDLAAFFEWETLEDAKPDNRAKTPYIHALTPASS